MSRESDVDKLSRRSFVKATGLAAASLGALPLVSGELVSAQEEAGLAAVTVLGLVLGKPIGILLGAGSVVMLKMGRLPAGASWASMVGLGLLAGIGFTMSLFIGMLAFEGAEAELAVSVRIGVLGGSAIAAVVGFLCLRFTLREPPANTEDPA